MGETFTIKMTKGRQERTLKSRVMAVPRTSKFGEYNGDCLACWGNMWKKQGCKTPFGKTFVVGKKFFFENG